MITDPLNKRVASIKYRTWWLWPLALFALAVLSVLASIFVYPEGTHEELWFFGTRFGGECGMKIQFGVPCPQCGMTRSWVWLVRGHVMKSYLYNPAGTLLLIWIVIAGLIGFARLVTRKPQLWSPPWIALFTWCMFWIFVPYIGFYVARLAGTNILPEFTWEAPAPPTIDAT